MFNLRRVFYGWWIALAGTVNVYYMSGTFWYGFGAFFNPIIEAFGWSRAATSVAFSLQQTEMGALAPIVGFVVDRYGPRHVMLLGVLVVGLGFILLSRINSLWSFYLAVVIIALGISFGSFLVVTITVGNWFVRLRGRAMALTYSGAGLAGTLVPLLVLLINLWGWRNALMAAGIGSWAIGIPTALLMRRRPEDYGVRPDGDVPLARQTVGRQATPEKAEGALRPQGDVALAEGDFTVRGAFRTAALWQFTLASSLPWMGMAAVTVHLIPAQISYGFSREVAALSVTLLTLISLVGRLGGGFLSDFVEKRYVLAVAFSLQAAGTFVLAVSTSYWHVISFLILYSVGFGAAVPTRVALLADYFGRKVFGSLLGIVMTFGTLLGVAGPIFTGWMFDLQESYRLAFTVVALVTLPSVPLILAMRRPKSPRTAPSPA